MAISHNPLCVMTLQYFSPALLRSFLVPLLFHPSTFHPLAFPSGTSLSSCLKIIFAIFPILFRVFLSISVPDGITFNPSTSLHHRRASFFGPTLLTMSHPPDDAFRHLDSLWLGSLNSHRGPSHFRGIFIFSVLCSSFRQRNFFAAAYFLVLLGVRSSKRCHSSSTH